MIEFETLQRELANSLVSATRSATQIAAEDVVFHRASDPSVAKSLDEKSSHLLSLAQKLILRARDGPSRTRARFTGIDDLETDWKVVVDSLDSLLERADTALDEYKGYFKLRSQQDREDVASTSGNNSISHKPRLFRNPDLPKPQLQFEDPPRNHEREPFKPLLTSKPHAHIPLKKSIRLENGHYTHPYALELDAFQYPARVYEQTEPISPPCFEDSHAVFVDTMDGVRDMLQELRQAQEIAIDLEHHDQHSYIGLVSLMQISSRGKDWIIDTLRPWRRKLECLNAVFTDPNIVKVLHGSTMDILWLQRDLGLYIVGLFDTYHASCVLGYSGHGLAFLLKRFVNFDAQKQYQMADWRLRPLPKELFDYARSDTHFLLYIYDCMRNELLQDSSPKCDKIEPVLRRSTNEALQRYEYPFYNDTAEKSSNGWYNLMWRNPPSLTDASLAVFRKVHQWRDDVARQEDESPNMIMPVQVLFSISRNLPQDKAALLSSSHPLSQFMRLRIEELLRVILDAIAQPEEGAYVRTAIAESRNKYLSSLAVSTSHAAATEDAETHLTAFDSAIIRAVGSSFWGGLADVSPTVPIHSASAFSVPVVPGLRGLNGCNDITNVAAESSVDPPTCGAAALVSGSGSKKRKHECQKEKEQGRGETTAPEPAAQDSSIDFDAKVPNAQSWSTDQIKALKDAALEKVRAKAVKKASKRPKVDAAGEDAEGEIIDYSRFAMSSSGADQKGEKKSTKKAFNPFTKGSEGDVGLGRTQQMRPGRTGTFKRNS